MEREESKESGWREKYSVFYSPGISGTESQ